MKAVVVTKHGGPDNMELQDLPTPSPEPGEVCIRVSRAGINFADILSRMGLYPGAPKPPFTPGMEVSGTIHELGPDVEGFEVGDRVVAVINHESLSWLGAKCSQLITIYKQLNKKGEYGIRYVCIQCG